ncbi:hypothetical protein R1flu_002423 [Riccia fluitans]|uniref:Cytochrome P450 n=1 Tax=Riccia fluitans TaxID=41844 RepID=A0ABD1Y6D0_9MARC
MEFLKNLKMPVTPGDGGFSLGRLNWASAPVPSLEVAVLSVIAVLLMTYFASVLKKNQRSGQMRTWPLVGSVPTLAANWTGLYELITRSLEKNEVVWVDYAFGFEGLYVADPALTEFMLKTNFQNYPKGTPVQERMRELLGHGIFAADGQQWKDTRKVASLQFSSAILRDFSADVFKERSMTLVRIISKFTESKKPIDMQDLFMRLTLDATCKVGFGVELGCLTPSLPDVPFSRNFDLANELSFHRYIDPFWKLKKVLNVGSEKLLKNCVDAMDEFCYAVIKKRRLELELGQRDGSKDKPDLLSRFMSMMESPEEIYTDKALRDHVVNFIIAGRDTTAITLSWFTYMICLHPEVAEKVYEEVTELERSESSAATEEGQDSLEDQFAKFAEVLTFYSVGKLNYLHAALTETLRLFPPVPLNGKIAEKDDWLPNGVKVKKGTMLTYSSYAMGRLERLWGPDAKEYKPERWLKDGAFQPVSPFKFISFHAGSRLCLGKESAYLQMKMAAAFLIRFFKFELVPNQEIRPRVMFVLAMAEGVKVIATPR